MLLHHPFRTLDALLTEDDLQQHSWKELFEACTATHHDHPRDTLRSWAQENRQPVGEDDDDDEEIDPDLAEMDEADWQVYMALFPNAMLPVYDFDDIGRRPLDDGWDIAASRNLWQNIDLMASYIANKRRENAGDMDQHGEDGMPLELDTLQQEQRQIFDRFVEVYMAVLNGEDIPQMRLNIDGTAGCGKTYLIRAICQELRRLAAIHEHRDPIRVLAPSGVAAWNINGRTLHSALSIPATSGPIAPLSGSRLATFQQEWRDVQVTIVDEKSMMGLRMLPKVDARLRQAKALDVPFGGIHIAIIGDFAQLPPVGDRPLYSPPCPVEDKSEGAELSRAGAYLYSTFTESYCLRTVHRQGGNSPAQQQFRHLLTHARDGGLSVDDWKLLMTRQQANVSAPEQELFRESICLFTKTEAVQEANYRQLVALNNPCARILAKHDGGAEQRRQKPPLKTQEGSSPPLCSAVGLKS